MGLKDLSCLFHYHNFRCYGLKGHANIKEMAGWEVYSVLTVKSEVSLAAPVVVHPIRSIRDSICRRLCDF